MEIINLNLIPTGTRPVVHASQYDNGRQFRANLFEGASVYTLTGAETLTFSVRKPDGHIVTEAVTNTSDNYVVIETTTQMCACAGDSFAELKIENGDDLIGTLNLILAVEQSPEEGGDPSESFIHNLEEQIAEAVADQYDSNNVIFDANPTAGHGVGFAVTSEGVLNAIPDELDDLSDVTTTTPASGEALIWDGAKWTNGTPALDVGDLDDVTITTPSNGEILVYNNGSWENQANPASTANFAPDYDDTATYNTNDKVIYQGLLYVCLEDSVTGAWDSTKWQNISVADYTAELLPIESGSATNTKDYIDSGLSGIPFIKSVLLSGTINCNTADTSTIGYRNTDGNKVNLTTRTGYPTGKTIIAYVVEKACITGNSNQGAIAVIDGTILNCNCKTNSICDWSVRVIYVD